MTFYLPPTPFDAATADHHFILLTLFLAHTSISKLNSGMSFPRDLRIVLHSTNDLNTLVSLSPSMLETRSQKALARRSTAKKGVYLLEKSGRIVGRCLFIVFA